MFWLYKINFEVKIMAALYWVTVYSGKEIDLTGWVIVWIVPFWIWHCSRLHAVAFSFSDSFPLLVVTNSSKLYIDYRCFQWESGDVLDWISLRCRGAYFAIVSSINRCSFDLPVWNRMSLWGGGSGSFASCWLSFYQYLVWSTRNDADNDYWICSSSFAFKHLGEKEWYNFANCFFK